MSAVVTFVGVLATVGLLLTNLLNLWLREADRKRLREMASESWLRYCDAGPSVVFRAPLLGLATLYDYLLGPRLLSARAIIRTFVISNLILLVALAAMGLSSGRPMGLQKPPWVIYSSNLAVTPQLAATYDQQAASAKTANERELAKSMAAKVRYYSTYNTPVWASVYTAVFATVMLVLCGGLNVAWIALTRRAIREVHDGKSGFVNFSVFLTTIQMAAVTFVFVAAIVGVLITPLMWVTLPLVPLLADLALWDTILSAQLVSSVVAMLVGVSVLLFERAVYIVAVAATVPLLLVLCAIVVAALLFPVRKAVHGVTSGLLLRAAEHKDSPAAYVVALLTLVVAIAAGLQRLFVWFLA